MVALRVDLEPVVGVVLAFLLADGVPIEPSKERLRELNVDVEGMMSWSGDGEIPIGECEKAPLHSCRQAYHHCPPPPLEKPLGRLK